MKNEITYTEINGINYGEDSFRALTAEELAEESECEDQEQVGGMHL